VAAALAVEALEVVDAQRSPQTHFRSAAFEELERAARSDSRVTVCSGGACRGFGFGQAAADGAEALFDAGLDISPPRELLVGYFVHIN